MLLILPSSFLQPLPSAGLRICLPQAEALTPNQSYLPCHTSATHSPSFSLHDSIPSQSLLGTTVLSIDLIDMHDCGNAPWLFCSFCFEHHVNPWHPHHSEEERFTRRLDSLSTSSPFSTPLSGIRFSEPSFGNNSTALARLKI